MTSITGKQWRSLPEHLREYFLREEPKTVRPIVLEPFHGQRNHRIRRPQAILRLRGM